MYEKKFNEDNVRPDGYNGHAVYTVSKPIECRYGTFKEGSKVVLEVGSLCSRGDNEIAFDVIGADERDIFTLEVSPDSVKWLNEHLKKDEELSRRYFSAAQEELKANTEVTKLETKVIQFVKTTFFGSLFLAMAAFIFVFSMNLSTSTLLSIMIPLGIIALSGVVVFLWYECVRENKYWAAECAYKDELKNILKENE